MYTFAVVCTQIRGGSTDSNHNKSITCIAYIHLMFFLQKFKVVQLVHYNSIICIKYTNHNSIKSYNYILMLQDGWTAFHIAAFNNHPDLIEVLISNGADITVVTKV